MKVVEFYALWLAALGSGEYPQARGRLRSKEGFCCLGVAADLLVKNALLEACWDQVGGLCFRGESHTGYLPIEVQEGLKLDTSTLDSGGVYFSGRLLGLNDGDRKTFPEIAAYIRQEILPKIDPNLELELFRGPNCAAVPDQPETGNSHVN